jgi:hypothetical protein
MDRTEWHRVNYACLSACLSVCLSVIDRDRVCWSLLSVPFEPELAELSHVRHAKHVPVQVRYIQYGTVPLQYRTHARLQATITITTARPEEEKGARDMIMTDSYGATVNESEVGVVFSQSPVTASVA